MKYRSLIVAASYQHVAPVRERGLKYYPSAQPGKEAGVAPVRERGLKSPVVTVVKMTGKSRSREGAWIEIAVGSLYDWHA